LLDKPIASLDEPSVFFVRWFWAPFFEQGVSAVAVLFCDEPKTNKKTENLGFQLKTLNFRTPKRRRASKSSKSRRKNNNPTDAVLYQFRTFCGGW
jgi:hypothetical protein